MEQSASIHKASALAARGKGPPPPAFLPLASSHLHVYFASYIEGDHWWLDETGNNWWSRRQRATCDIIYLQEKGVFSLSINGTAYRIIPGMLVYIPAGSDLVFFYDGDGPLEKHYVHFDLSFEGSPLSTYFSFLPIAYTTPEVHARCRELFSCICDGYRDTGARRLSAQGALFSLVAEFLSSQASRTLMSEEEDPIRATAQWLEAHYKEHPTVELLACRIGYNTAYFSRKFKSAIGVSPSAYVSNLIVAEAKRLLREGELSVSEIALSLGFCDSCHFSNYFKVKTGVYPTKYKELRNGF